MTAKQVAEKLISEHVVAFFSKSYCPYCTRAKGLINSLGLEKGKVGILELDRRDDGADIQAYLMEKSGQRTVPNIFINQKHLGGCDDLFQASSQGKLEQLLA